MTSFRTNISASEPRIAGKGDSYSDELDLDVLIVGAGFGGCYLLHRFRDDLGLKTKVWEAGEDLGGVWHWNRYPGACVDSPVPVVYELTLPKLWKDWYWSSTYPTWDELQQYFDHMAEKLEIRKDVAFESRVVSAEFDLKSNKWKVESQDGRVAHCRYLVLAMGFAAKRNFPDWKGLEDFRGEIYHSSFWPEGGVDVKGKRVAIVGCGATGNQIVQTTGKDAAHLTLFQRTCNLAIPMKRKPLSKEEQDEAKKGYPERFQHKFTTFAGFAIDFVEKNTFDDTPEEREKFYEELWEKGGFNFWLANYKDMLFDEEANNEAFRFWRKKTLPIVTDPRKQKILCPEKPPHPFGTKRPALSEGYFETLNDPKNDVVDINDNPVVEVRENGILTKDGEFREFDVIALATGFDGVTGGMMDMGLKDINGVPIKDKWKDGTYTYLGMTCHNYPNLFFLYGPQGPTAFANGPSAVELQGNWIVDAINKLRTENITFLNAQEQSEKAWRENIRELSEKTLFPKAKSWYMGANVPGKVVEQLNYAGGMPLYYKETRDVLDNNFKGFDTVAPTQG